MADSTKCDDPFLKLEERVELYAKDIKSKQKAQEYRTSAESRIECITPRILLPLHRLQNSPFMGKTPRSILDSIKKVRESTKLFPLSTRDDLIEEINKLCEDVEVSLYEMILSENTLQSVYDRLGSFGKIRKYILEGTEREPIPEQEARQYSQQFLQNGLTEIRDEKLRLLRQACDSAGSQILISRIGIDITRGRESFQSWSETNNLIFQLYLLLLPFYLNPSGIRNPMCPSELLEIIKEILKTEISALEKLTANKIKANIKAMIMYRLKNKLQRPSIEELLQYSAAIQGNYDKAILYPYSELLRNRTAKMKHSQSLTSDDDAKFDLRGWLSKKQKK